MPDNYIVVVKDQKAHSTSAATAQGLASAYDGENTFIAGLLQLHARDAHVSSMELMGDHGEVCGNAAIAAVEWLAGEERGERAVDLVCMAFGRPQRDGDAAEAQPLRAALADLGGLGVRVVAACGNGGCDGRTVPAAFGVEPRMPVVGVGACDAAGAPAKHSNFGTWGARWRDGTDVVSTRPLTTELSVVARAFATWTRTSFAAAIHCGELAQSLIENATPSQPPWRAVA